MSVVHVIPRDDLTIHYAESHYCVCDPAIETVRCADGCVGWVIVHHSLDGREADE